jgi:tetratricopeptide (TPR) repeat protein
MTMTPTREVAFRTALEHYKASRPRAAADLFEEVLKADPHDTEALLLLGILRMETDPDAAEALLTRCVALAPGHPFALHNLGKLQQQRGDHWAAIQLFRKSAAGNATFAPTFNDLGASLHQVGEREAALAAVDRAIAIDPDYTTAHRNRGFILMEMQRSEDARQAFHTVLASAHQSADAWHNFGTAHYNLGEFEPAIEACRQALVLDPSHLAAYGTLAQALHRVHRVEEAARVQTEWARRQRVTVTRCRGEYAEARILLVGAAEICNVPTEFLFDRTHFETISIYLLPPAESEEDLIAFGNELPDVDVVFNAVGDADRGAQFLDRASNVFRKLDRPIVNPPDRILRTRRDNIPELLKGVSGLALPATRRVARADISALAAESEEIERPLLLRPIGSHGGDDLVRVKNCAQIAAYLRTVHAEEFYLSDFWDFRSEDGYFRKYRLIFVDRKVYPYHLAISKDWLVHYWRADMVDWMKREEEAFLADFRSVFRDAAADVAVEVARRLDLDYAGMDCSILPDGQVLLFEANATMLVHLRESCVTSAYKHAHVPRIVDAMTDLIRRRVGARPDHKSHPERTFAGAIKSSKNSAGA